eukprot:Polyplicarium_translucidae@DN1653_c0_g1_i3.p1
MRCFGFWGVAGSLWMVGADLPVHCTHGDVLGVWEVHVGDWLTPCGDDFGTDPLCGYSAPDNENMRDGLRPGFDLSSSFVETGNETAIFSKTRFEGFGEQGPWTIVYDEAIHFQTSQWQYFAYFQYRPAADSPGFVDSYCGLSLVGWRTPFGRQGRGSCFWMVKVADQHGWSVDPQNPTNRVPAHRGDGFPIAKEASRTRPTTRGDIKPWLERLRRLDSLPWQPVAEDHVAIGAHNVTSMHALNRYSGTTRRKPHGTEDWSLHAGAFGEPMHSQSAARHRRHNQRRLEPDVPRWDEVESFDWTDVDDVYSRLGHATSVVPPTVTQGPCGSCYAVAAAAMQTSRLWIQNPDDPRLFRRAHVSPEQAYKCSVYNQGCAGGYVFLALKFSHEYGMRTAECVEDWRARGGEPEASLCAALGGQVPCACGPPTDAAPLPTSCALAGRVRRWGYVGGAYGRSSESEMRREIFEHGPVAVSLRPTPEFMAYRGGVFSSPTYSAHTDNDDPDGNDTPFDWEEVNHAALVVGFGVSTDERGVLQRWWKVQNSWGPSWGDGGFARVARGRNEMGIEHACVFADVEMVG